MFLEQDKNFIASVVGLRKITYQVSASSVQSSALVTDLNGNKYIKAGTIISTAGETPVAVGVLAHDTTVTKADGTSADGRCALIVAGHLYSDQLPVAPTSAQVTALASKGLYFETMPTTTVQADGTLA